MVFFVMAPVVVAGVVPWWMAGWTLEQSGWSMAGWPLLVAGLVVLLDSVRRFAVEGLGTPAPIYPTELLVVTGLYRYVRNPMYLAVVGIILAQALLFGSVKLVGYGMAVWAIFHLFVLFYEEPKLRKTYPSEYGDYCRAVRRWMPVSGGLRRGRS